MNGITILLQPIKVGIERIGRSNTTILDAEGVLIFILDNLVEKNNFFANKLLQSGQQRIEECRIVNLVSLLKFLNNPFTYNHELNINSKLILPSKYALKAAAKNLPSYILRMLALL